MANATQTTLGDIQLAGDLSGVNNALAPELTSTGVTAGSYVIPHITVDAKGRITSATSGASADITALIPHASDTVYGTVKIGSNILFNSSAGYVIVDYNGTLTNSTQTNLCAIADTISVVVTQVLNGVTTARTVKITGADANGTVSDFITAFNAAMTAVGLSVTLSLTGGNLVLTIAEGSGNTVTISNDNVFANITGFVAILTNVVGTGDGTIWIPIATTSVPGVIKVGSGLSVNNGVVSFDGNSISNATTSSKGIVQIGNNIDVTSGVISVKTATETDKGIVSIGSGLSVTNGAVSLNTPDATTTSKGVVQVTQANGLSITNGVLAMAGVAVSDATAISKGIVQIGSGIAVTGGVISADTGALTVATASVKGIAQIGDGLSVSAGNVTLNRTSYATDTIAGVIKVGTTLSIASGVLDVATSVVRTDTSNTFTKAQIVSLVTLTDAATIAIDLSLSNNFIVTLAGNRTLGTPTNPVIGGQYTLILKQDATGSRTITWPASFKFRTNQSTTLTTTAGKYDICSMVYVASGVYLCDLIKGF